MDPELLEPKTSTSFKRDPLQKNKKKKLTHNYKYKDKYLKHLFRIKKKSQQNVNFKKLTNITMIRKSRRRL